MFNWDRISDKAIKGKVQKEAEAFMARCHFGSQGVVKTEADIKSAVLRLLDSGLHAIAFDTEMNYVETAKNMLDGWSPIHCAVSYPLGRMQLKKKMQDLATLLKLGVLDTCVCLDWQAIFSKRYEDVEKEATLLMREFGGAFKYNAFVIPATLMSDTELVEVLKVLDNAGVISVKINPGAKLNVSFEEVELIQRKFPNRFDIHPSGGIRTLEEVERYLELGCKVIHSVSSLEITERFIERQIINYGGHFA